MFVRNAFRRLLPRSTRLALPALLAPAIAFITVISPANKTLTFTPQNYGTAQTVTLSAAHDSDRFDGSRDINHASTSSDSSYSNLSASLTATEDDDDSAHARDTSKEFSVTSDSAGIWSNGTTL